MPIDTNAAIEITAYEWVPEMAARARAIGWAFAALNSIEPFMQTLFFMSYFTDGKDWLEDRFTIGDLLMIDVLRAGTPPELVTRQPNLVAHVERGTSRPAFKAAHAAQLAAFKEAA